MKGLVSKVIIVLIGLIIVDFVVQFACNKMLDILDGESESRIGSQAIENYCLNAVHCDLLIVGSSPANCGFDTKLISDSISKYDPNGHIWKVANASRSQSEIPWKYCVIMSAIDRNPPRAILLDINTRYSLNKDKSTGIVSVMRSYYYRNKYVKEVLDEYDEPREKFLYKLSGLYRFRSSLFALPLQFTKPFGGDGYMPYYANIDSSEVRNLNAKDSSDVDTSALKYLIRIINKCKTNNIKLVITLAPKLIITKKNCDSYRTLVRICKENNIELIDMGDDIRFNNYRLHYDKGHINAKGAELYSSIISQRLRDIIFDVNQ